MLIFLGDLKRRVFWDFQVGQLHMDNQSNLVFRDL